MISRICAVGYLVCGLALAGGLARAQSHFVFAGNTGNNATVAVPASINPTADGQPLQVGDEIGVFSPGGMCAGAVVWTGVNVALTVWGDDDQTTLTDGMHAGETLTYRIWRLAANTEDRAVIASYSQGAGTYAPNGISVLASLSGSLMGVVPLQLAGDSFSLGQNYPNPFNPSTRITYTVPGRSDVTLAVYDVLGREVAQLVKGVVDAGSHTVEFSGTTLPSGAYFFSIKAGNYSATRRMLLIK